MSFELIPQSPQASSPQGDTSALPRRSESNQSNGQPKTKPEFVQYLLRSQKRNEFGFPNVLYRSDLLMHPSEFFAAPLQEREDALQAAEVYIDFQEGFPSIFGGMPIWAQFPHESADSYALFEAYLTQNTSLDDDTERALSHRNHYAAARSKVHIREIWTLARDVGVAQSRIQELYAEYMWALRASAFDTYMVVAYEKARVQRVISAENNAFLMTENLLSKAKGYWKTFEFTTDTDPIIALKITETMAKMQREAIRLQNTNGGGKGGNGLSGPGNLSAQEILRAVTAERIPTDSSQGSNPLDILLEDDDLVAQAQALIVRISQQSE
jgi:hypothetical protein